MVITANTTNFLSGKKLFTQLFVSTLYGVLTFLYLFYSKYGSLPVLANHVDTVSFIILSSWIVFSFLFITSHWLNSLFPWEKSIAVRFMSQFFANLIAVTLLLVISLRLFIFIKYPDVTAEQFQADKWDATLKFGIIFTVTNLIYVLIDLYQFSFTRFIKANIETEKMVRERLRLQYEVLKSQLSPHYLFNSLNTISSLVYRDANTTEGFIRKFALTFSYIFDSHEKDLVTVREEIKFIEAYVFLLYIRFENALTVNINLTDAAQSSFIPPLTLQLLVENAVKHNHLTDDKPLTIDIHDNKEGYITVSNNFERKPGFIEVNNQLVKKPVTQHSHKVGLENIKKRYSFFCDKEIRIMRNANFVVQLPLLTKLKKDQLKPHIQGLFTAPSNTSN